MNSKGIAHSAMEKKPAKAGVKTVNCSMFSVQCSLRSAPRAERLGFGQREVTIG